MALAVAVSLLALPAAAFAVSEGASSPARVPSAASTPDDVEDPASPTPVDSISPIPSPTPTAPTATPTPSPTGSASPDETATPQPSPTDTVSPTPDPTTTVTPLPIPAVPPALVTSTVSLPSLLIALGVLLAGGLFVWALLRRDLAAERAVQPTLTVADPTATPTPVVLTAMATLGSAMVDSGYPVGMVRAALEDMARANGHPDAEAVVFPTSLLVSTGDGESTQTRAMSAGDSSFLLHQVEAVDHIVTIARTRPGGAEWARLHVERVSQLAAPFTRAQRIAAYGLLSAALAVLLGSSWLGVGLAGVLGLAVGTLLLFSQRVAPSFQSLVVVGAALGVALAMLVVARVVDPGVLPAVIAPLVMLLPGGLLTIAVIELATGQIMSGAARAAAGAMRLLLLAIGIVAAGALVGIPAIEPSPATNPLGPVAPWVAVAVFGIGITIYQCARPASIGWILVVLYVAYGAQVVGDVFFDGVLSALIGAVAMTPVAVVIARQRTGPPALVSFLPAFWLLVPGALGLIGVTTVLGGDSTGSNTIIATIATMVAIALGVLIGLAATNALHRAGPNRDAKATREDTPSIVARENSLD